MNDDQYYNNSPRPDYYTPTTHNFHQPNIFTPNFDQEPSQFQNDDEELPLLDGWCKLD